MLNHIEMLKTFILAFNGKRKSEEGATAVEYGLMVAAIAAVIVVVVFAIGDLVGGAFDATESGLTDGGVVSR